MEIIKRFKGILQGAMVLICNTLQIRQGITFSASQSSSTAILNIMTGSTVVFAQLFWTQRGTTSNASINLVTPKGTNSIAPNTALNQIDVDVSWRAQDVTSIVNSAVISSSKTVSPTNTTVGDTLFYTIILKNIGNLTANNVTFIDTIPNNTTFQANSLALNNNIQTGYSPAPPNGFSVGSMVPNEVATITFRVTIDTLPSPNPIPNSVRAI